MKYLDQFVNHGDRITLAYWGGYSIDLVPHIGDVMVCMTPLNDPSGYEWGWCYPSTFEAIIFVSVWDPETEAEPTRYQKHYTHTKGTRTAGTCAKGYVAPTGAQLPPTVTQSTPTA